MAYVNLTRATILTAMQSQPVRDALAVKARQLADRADALGVSEGVEMDCRVESGTRPKGRPYSNVVSEQWEQEWGSRDSERRRILGRAAGY